MQHSFLKPRRWQWRIGLAAIPCLAFNLATHTGVAGAFTVETLDNQHLEWPALAIDAQGNSHIACYSWSSQGSGLEYGLKTETGWTQEWVPGASGYDVSLAVDANGGVHATYYNAGNLVPLQYASRTPSGWSQETIEIVGPPDQVTLGGTSLAIDPQGRPHVAYSVSGILKYAERTSNGWSVETVDGSGAPMPDSKPALALDPLGNPHISYSGDTSLRIAERTAGQWSTDTVASAQGLGSALAINSEGRPHVSWTDERSESHHRSG